MRYLIALLLFTLTPPITADGLPTSPIVATVPCAGGVLTIHDDDTVALVRLDAETNRIAVSVAVQDPPVLSTTYVDTVGQTHTVETPIVSTTPAAIRRAVAAHKTLLTAVQAAFPPAPPPPPPAPPNGGTGG